MKKYKGVYAPQVDSARAEYLAEKDPKKRAAKKRAWREVRYAEENRRQEYGREER